MKELLSAMDLYLCQQKQPNLEIGPLKIIILR